MSARSEDKSGRSGTLRLAGASDLYAQILAQLSPADRELLHRGLAARGHELCDQGGQTVGTIVAVLIDRETAQPQWLAVEDPLRQRLVGVPIACLEAIGSRYRTPVRAAGIQAAPDVPLAGLPAKIEHALCRHYGLARTRGATEPADRRATSSRAFQDPGGTGQIGWLPGPRGS
ncbi:MAG TPA: hypothetical protein VMU90_14485 [Solirubrobacteraceae bacterium]|nr:hypothetical protein [Solirubrobacteraceae bacterium]